MGEPGRIEVSNRRWSWLLEFCGVDSDNLELLASTPSEAVLGERVADEFLAMASRYPELRELIDRTTHRRGFQAPSWRITSSHCSPADSTIRALRP